MCHRMSRRKCPEADGAAAGTGMRRCRNSESKQSVIFIAPAGIAFGDGYRNVAGFIHQPDFGSSCHIVGQVEHTFGDVTCIECVLALLVYVIVLVLPGEVSCTPGQFRLYRISAHKVECLDASERVPELQANGFRFVLVYVEVCFRAPARMVYRNSR